METTLEAEVLTAAPEPTLLDLARPGTTLCGPFTLRWRELGRPTGPVVLLLHGIYAGAHGYEWRRLASLLAVDHRVRVLDLLGAGESDKPDLDYTPEVLTRVVHDAIVDAGPDVRVVASSLTGAHALRAVSRGAKVAQLTLITPTGLGSAQTQPPTRWHRAAYLVGRHSPLGDLLIDGLSSAPSVRWFQTHQTYLDPENLTEEEVEQTRTAARLTNAKHLQLAFVFDQLAVRLDDDTIGRVEPLVIWGSGQRFVDDDEADRWRAAGAEVVVFDSGLPQVEDPARVVDVITAHFLD